jgi:light-regulated signal transduction histidine kinase (bacteriophytochrome)
MLFAVTQPDLLVAAVSENVAAALRLDPEELISGRIGQLLDDRSTERLAALRSGDTIASSVTVQLRHPAPRSQWDAMVHRSGRLNLVELEPRSADDGRLSDQVRTASNGSVPASSESAKAPALPRLACRWLREFERYRGTIA